MEGSVISLDGYIYPPTRCAKLICSLPGTRYAKGPACLTDHLVTNSTLAFRPTMSEFLQTDWATTPLGFWESWPPQLSTMLSFLFATKTPAWLVWGPELTLIYNEAYRPLLGDKPKAMGQPLRTVWGEVWPDVGPLIERTVEGESVSVDNARLLVDRGHGLEEAWFTFSYTPVTDGNVVQGFICIVTETTSQALALRSQDFMNRLEDTLRGLSEPLDIIQASQRLLGQHLGANRVGYGSVDSTERYFTTEKNWTDGRIESFNGTHDLAAFGPDIHSALKRGEPLSVDDVNDDARIDADGRTAFAYLQTQSALTASLVKNDRMIAAFYIHCGTVRRWSTAELKLVQDVADRTWSALERAHAQAALEQANRELELRVESTRRDHDRLWEISQELMLVADHVGIITSINPSAKRILGREPQSMVGHSIVEFIHPEDTSATEKEVGLLAKGHATLAFENRYRHADGTYRILNWTAVPFEEHIHAVARDVTAEREANAALRQTEDALRHAQKMEAVGQLTGGIAHDFNNIIAGISGSLELISTRLAQGRFGEIDRYLNGAAGASKRAAGLTQRLLAFSRRQTLDPKPTNLASLISGLLDLIQRSVGPSITVTPVGIDDLWTVLVDAGQLENALLNLCINARDAMTDGGTIKIETSNQSLDAVSARQRGLSAGDYVSLCVSDTGVGMTSDVLEKATEPFYTTKPIGQGTGLGLSMVYGFVGQSGGTMRIDSEVGKGTTVCLYLPRFAGETSSDETSPRVGELALAPEPKTILLVDDEPLVRMIALDGLEELGYRVIEAGDASSALRHIGSDMVIDLLVTDVGLPGGMNGRQLAEAAQQMRPGLNVLFITGYADNAVLNHGHLGQGMQVLTKPFPIDALAEKVQALIKSN